MVGLGTNNFGGRTDEAGSRQVIDAAIDAGINLFDTADVYSAGASEEIIGRGIKGRRDAIVLATKFRSPMGEGPNEQGGSRRYILRAVEASLRRLQTDYIDLYQMHAPDSGHPLRKRWTPCTIWCEQAKYGTSAPRTSRVANSRRCLGGARAPREPVHLRAKSLQPGGTRSRSRGHSGLRPVWGRHASLLPAGVRLVDGEVSPRGGAPSGTRLANSPRSSRFLSDAKFDLMERLERFGAERGVTILQVAIGGLAAQPQVASVIAGATKPEQIGANVEAGTWKPTPDDLAELDLAESHSASQLTSCCELYQLDIGRSSV